MRQKLTSSLRKYSFWLKQICILGSDSANPVHSKRQGEKRPEKQQKVL